MTTSEFITVGLNAAMISLTSLYVYLTHKILRSSNSALQEQLRPYVIVSYYCQDTKLYLRIQNVGKRPAVGVQCRFTPDLDQRIVDPRTGIDTAMRMLQQKLLVPNQKHTHVIRFNSDYFQDPEREAITTAYEATVTYADSENNDFTERYQIELLDVLIAKKIIETSKKRQLEAIEQ
jgi:hypothetical protein